MVMVRVGFELLVIRVRVRVMILPYFRVGRASSKAGNRRNPFGPTARKNPFGPTGPGRERGFYFLGGIVLPGYFIHPTEMLAEHTREELKSLSSPPALRIVIRIICMNIK